MAQKNVKYLICLALLVFTSCGVKGPPTPYLDVVAKEKALEEAKLQKQAAEQTPSPTPEALPAKKKSTNKKK